METNTGQDVGRSCLGHTAICTRRLARLCAHKPIAVVAVHGLPRRGSCKKAPLHGAADVDEFTMPTLVHLYHYTNVLPTVWRKLCGNSPPCGAEVDPFALTSPFVVHCQLFKWFGIWLSASKLA
ncbi:hypothetical protein TNCV_3361591 [Trichonephila clavipes]|nr:hypothetical protein TNCV_3361591 [Trichonephila clavipes]